MSNQCMEKYKTLKIVTFTPLFSSHQREIRQLFSLNAKNLSLLHVKMSITSAISVFIYRGLLRFVLVFAFNRKNELID